MRGSDRGDPTASLVAQICRRLERAAGTPAPGTLLRGPWGSGTSSILRRVAARLRRDGAAVALRVSDDADPLDLPPSDTLLIVDDAHRLSGADARRVRDRMLNGDAPVLLGGRAVEQYPEPIAWALTAGVLVPTTPPEARADDLVRALPSPGRLHLGSARRILDAAGGRLGFASDLVRGGVAAGTVRLRNGLWRIVGELDVRMVRERLDFELRRLDPASARDLRLVCLLGWVPDDDLPGLDREAVAALTSRGYLRAGDSDGFAPDPPVLAVAARSGGRVPSELARLLVERHVGRAPALSAVRWHRAADIEPPREWCEAAARELWAAGHGADALHLLEEAGVELGMLRLRAEILADLGRRDEGLAVLERIERAATGATRRAAAAERASITMWDVGRRDEALAISGRVASDAAAGPHDRLRHALLLLESGRLEDADRRARELDADEVAAPAMSILATVAALRGDGDGARELARGAVRGASPVGPAPPVATLTLVLALTEAGDLREADDAANAGLTVPSGTGRGADAWLGLSRARVALLRGAISEARGLAWEAAEVFADLDQGAMYQWAVATRLLAEASGGDDAATVRLLEELEALEEPRVIFVAHDVGRARAWGALARGDRPTARARMRGVAQTAESRGAWGLACQAWHDLAVLGDADAAADALEELRARTTGAWAAPRASHARALADRDAEGALAAAERFRSFDALTAAVAAAGGARVIARERGDRAVERRASGLLIRWSTDHDIPVDASDGVALTPRERQIAELAAGGRTSREIADKLRISPRTAQNLLHRAYHKLDVHDREALATILARDGVSIRMAAREHGRS